MNDEICKSEEEIEIRPFLLWEQLLNFVDYFSQISNYSDFSMMRGFVSGTLKLRNMKIK